MTTAALIYAAIIAIALVCIYIGAIISAKRELQKPEERPEVYRAIYDRARHYETHD